MTWQASIGVNMKKMGSEIWVISNVNIVFRMFFILLRIVATSQMHPTHARKTFPCFDEPALKAVFHITLIHPPGTVALSNGKEIGR
ncbi:hypothetical protein F7725_022338 [Dissostichus mawsoni]|uniref:Aminopeptidase N-like N-terminal domain-containing protein n=1 Tax=Dissostichus mawsoni TaxID=36200 RepID=A0A7J5YYM3_DISMA|nr:hypothetical protein F7725_022338 [Dissostichus mawsoni]